MEKMVNQVSPWQIITTTKAEMGIMVVPITIMATVTTRIKTRIKVTGNIITPGIIETDRALW